MSTEPTDNSTNAEKFSALDSPTLQQLEQFIDSAVTKAMAASREFDGSFVCNRLAYSEPEAASLLGVKKHVIRDARRRGEIEATRVGGRISYTREDLLNYLEEQKGKVSK